MYNNSLFHTIISDSHLSNSIISYLSFKDILSLLSTSKRTSKSISYNLLINECYKSSPFTFSFYLQNHFEILNRKKILNALNTADKLYETFYYQSNFVIKCFYFSFLVLGVDLSTFLVACVKVDKRLNFIYQIPMIFNWIISVVLCIVYIFRYNSLKKRIKHLIKKNLTNMTTTSYNIEQIFLAKKMKLRNKHKQPIAFLQISLLFIIFYFPILVKTCMKYVKSSYRKAFWASSILIFLYMLLRKIYKIIKKKIKYRKDKPFLYKKLFSNNKEETQLYKETMCEIKINEKRSNCGEVILFCSYIFGYLFGYLLLLIYLDALGSKLDNPNENISWFALFSPAYFVLLLVILWGIIYCYSTKGDKTLLNKKVLVITIIIIVLGLVGNVVIIPLMLEDIINISTYWPFGVFCLITISIFYHYCLFQKQKRIPKSKTIT